MSDEGKIWRVGWIDEDGNTLYSVPLDSKESVAELCKSVDHFNLSPTADVWIEWAAISWNRIT